jgi:acyl carrier protein
VNQREARELLEAILRDIAPELDLAAVDPDAALRDELGLDSVDFLHLIEEIYARTRVNIPEADYARLQSVNSTLSYLKGVAP